MPCSRSCKQGDRPGCSTRPGRSQPAPLAPLPGLSVRPTSCCRWRHAPQQRASLPPAAGGSSHPFRRGRVRLDPQSAEPRRWYRPGLRRIQVLRASRARFTRSRFSAASHRPTPWGGGSDTPWQAGWRASRVTQPLPGGGAAVAVLAPRLPTPAAPRGCVPAPLGSPRAYRVSCCAATPRPPRPRLSCVAATVSTSLLETVC
jgi:hypothetical protein